MLKRGQAGFVKNQSALTHQTSPLLQATSLAFRGVRGSGRGGEGDSGKALNSRALISCPQGQTEPWGAGERPNCPAGLRQEKSPCGASTSPGLHPRRKFMEFGLSLAGLLQGTNGPVAVEQLCRLQRTEETQFICPPLRSSRGAQTFGISGSCWKKNSCLGPHIKYIVTRYHKKISQSFK